MSTDDRRCGDATRHITKRQILCYWVHKLVTAINWKGDDMKKFALRILKNSRHPFLRDFFAFGLLAIIGIELAPEKKTGV
jgi:hypothetical protein